MTFLKRNALTIFGVALGAIAGLVYYSQTACSSGACIITSSPYTSGLYGSLLGGLLFSSFQKTPKS